MKKIQKAVQKVFRFRRIVERFPDKGGWHFVRFPYVVEELFRTRGTVRVTGTINGIAVDRGLIPDGNGGHLIVLGSDLRRKAGVRLGNEVTVELSRHTAPDEVALPEEMEEAFKQAPEAKVRFERCNPGIRRSLMSYITSGKRADTRATRATMLLERFLSGYYAHYERK